MDIRIKIGKEKYLIWNRLLTFGEDTPSEDLWKGGYEFSRTVIWRIPIILVKKR